MNSLMKRDVSWELSIHILISMAETRFISSYVRRYSHTGFPFSWMAKYRRAVSPLNASFVFGGFLWRLSKVLNLPPVDSAVESQSYASMNSCGNPSANNVKRCVRASILNVNKRLPSPSHSPPLVSSPLQSSPLSPPPLVSPPLSPASPHLPSPLVRSPLLSPPTLPPFLSSPFPLVHPSPTPPLPPGKCIPHGVAAVRCIRTYDTTKHAFARWICRIREGTEAHFDSWLPRDPSKSGRRGRTWCVPCRSRLSGRVPAEPSWWTRRQTLGRDTKARLIYSSLKSTSFRFQHLKLWKDVFFVGFFFVFLEHISLKLHLYVCMPLFRFCKSH